MTVPDQRLQTGMGDPVPDVLRIWLEPFRGAFTAPTWRLVLVLVMGALLAPGKRTVSACLRITGRAMAANYASYHQVLNRARWRPPRPRTATRTATGGNTGRNRGTDHHRPE